MKLMTPRERVSAAMNFQKSDRIPTAIGGGPYGIVDALYEGLLEYYSLGESVEPFRQGHSISYLDDRIFECLETDFRYVYPTLSPSSPIQKGPDDKTFLDAFGQTWKRALPYYYAGEGILSDISSADQVNEIIQWPDVDDSRWFAKTEQRAKELKENTNYWITARQVVSHGPFQYASDLRGVENFMMDMALRPILAYTLLNKIGEVYCGLYERYLQVCGESIDMIELPGDDYAGNKNLIVSLKMFREFVKPVLKSIISTIRSHRSDIKIMMHSDGAIAKLIPDLIELGVDVLHPLEPLEATDQAVVKQQFKGQIVFLGGVNITHALQGPKNEVITEVERVLNDLAPGSGDIFAPSNHLQADIPPENVALLFESARSFPLESKLS